MVQVKHVDATQGRKEERMNRIDNTESERLTSADTVVRYKQFRSFWLRQKAGICGA